MENLIVHGIDDNGFNDSSLDLHIQCNPKATLATIRDLISENVYTFENPEKIHLIKRSEDDEEVLEDLSTILDEVLEDKDSLYFYITPFAREGVTITLKVTKEALEWINTNTKVGIKFLVGTTKDFIEFPLNQPEKKIEVHKKSFWRFPADAKVALGMKTGNDNFFSATQFVVENESELEIHLRDANLEVWINSKKEIGLSKRYPIEKTGKRKYISKAFEVGKVVLTGANLVTTVLS